MSDDEGFISEYEKWEKIKKKFPSSKQELVRVAAEAKARLAIGEKIPFTRCDPQKRNGVVTFIKQVNMKSRQRKR